MPVSHVRLKSHTCETWQDSAGVCGGDVVCEQVWAHGGGLRRQDATQVYVSTNNQLCLQLGGHRSPMIPERGAAAARHSPRGQVSHAQV